MRQLLVVAAMGGLLGGCGSLSATLPEDAARDQFGVSASRPASAGTSDPDPQVRQLLEWHANQICTSGYDFIQQSFDEAEADQQIVDWAVRCQPYRLAVPIPFSHPLTLPSLF